MDNFTNYINSHCLEEKSILNFRRSFSNVKPFKHIVIKNFLKNDVAKILYKAILSESFIEKESDLFHMFQTDDLYFSSNLFLKSFNSSFLDWNFLSLIESITGVSLVGTVSMSASCYKKNNYLLCHDDLVEGRRIAYILYLSKDFSSHDGGKLNLYSSDKNKDAKKIIKSVIPIFNSLVLFEVSGTSFHEVGENVSHKDRYAIGGWFE